MSIRVQCVASYKGLVVKNTKLNIAAVLGLLDRYSYQRRSAILLICWEYSHESSVSSVYWTACVLPLQLISSV